MKLALFGVGPTDARTIDLGGRVTVTAPSEADKTTILTITPADDEAAPPTAWAEIENGEERLWLLEPCWARGGHRAAVEMACRAAERSLRHAAPEDEQDLRAAIEAARTASDDGLLVWLDRVERIAARASGRAEGAFHSERLEVSQEYRNYAKHALAAGAAGAVIKALHVAAQKHAVLGVNALKSALSHALAVRCRAQRLGLAGSSVRAPGLSEADERAAQRDDLLALLQAHEAHGAPSP